MIIIPVSVSYLALIVFELSMASQKLCFILSICFFWAIWNLIFVLYLIVIAVFILQALLLHVLLFVWVLSSKRRYIEIILFRVICCLSLLDILKSLIFISLRFKWFNSHGFSKKILFLQIHTARGWERSFITDFNIFVVRLL